MINVGQFFQNVMHDISVMLNVKGIDAIFQKGDGDD